MTNITAYYLSSLYALCSNSPSFIVAEYLMEITLKLVPVTEVVSSWKAQVKWLMLPRRFTLPGWGKWHIGSRLDRETIGTMQNDNIKVI